MEQVLKDLLSSRKKFVALGVTSLLVLLTACTPMNSAATIGKTSISSDKLQKSVAQIISERGKVSTQGMNLETGEALNRSQVTFFVISELLLQIGKENKISVSEQEITKQISAVTEQVGGAKNLPGAMVNAGIAPQNLREYFRTYLMSAKISNLLISAGFTKDNVTAAVQKLVSDESKKLKVSINPRYGVWDSAKVTILAAPLAAGSVTK
jgi:hypothetical protein